MKEYRAHEFTFAHDIDFEHRSLNEFMSAIYCAFREILNKHIAPFLNKDTSRKVSLDRQRARLL